ncbi:phage shock protein C (PspC) family protein [Actinopolyspora mzabensis]|uniref:Phage shock protein C (PspC) family protein n=1 Tax=Actinopolyspora mzabensis TaxID=995066 RepID=A0A1G8VGJ5_ACTMZ|nr:PspC domain-containing protein [Actinopolyspora mzabensis]SDJ65017.1 phage shock protein C (PspC) family protein [Actinopolyspora mzabensis]
MNGGTTDGGQHESGGQYADARAHTGPSGTGSGGTARTGGSNGARGTWAEIKGTFRDFWDTRPARPSEGRKIAGVAAALGNRYGVDPVLLRVVFVIGTFYGGAGLLFYLLGWATLPKSSDAPGNTAVRLAVLALITVVFVPASLAAFDMPGVFGLALGVLALYLLHRHFGGRLPARRPYGSAGPYGPSGTTTNVAPQPGMPPSGESEGSHSPVRPTHPPERSAEPPEAAGPTGYEPSRYGTAEPEQSPATASHGTGTHETPFSESRGSESTGVETTGVETERHTTVSSAATVPIDAPASSETTTRVESPPYGPPAPEPPRYSTEQFGRPPNQPPPTGWTSPTGEPRPPARGSTGNRGPRYSITLATLGITLLVGGFGIALGLAAVKIWALMLGVLGCGMLAGSFLRRGRWLILFAVPVALAAMLSTVLPERPWEGYTNAIEAPENATELASEYSGSLGNVTLHLENMRFPADKEVATDVALGMGTVTVHLPPETDARVTCASDMGRVDCLGNESSGRNLRITENDLGTDGPGGGSVRLNLMTETGSVEVVRGY